MGLANSLALKLAGISNNTTDPDGGTVMRNSLGGSFFHTVSSFISIIKFELC